MLGILTADDLSEAENPDLLLPKSVKLLLDKDVWRTGVYGDYDVCPLTKSHPGAMQMVCIAGAENLVAKMMGPNG
jgi:hypothetical protein